MTTIISTQGGQPLEEVVHYTIMRGMKLQGEKRVSYPDIPWLAHWIIQRKLTRVDVITLRFKEPRTANFLKRLRACLDPGVFKVEIRSGLNELLVYKTTSD